MSHKRDHTTRYAVCSLLAGKSPERRDLARSRSSEAGYTLVALLALMTLMALFATAAAPSIHQQVQREREKESIFRGEQVADAMRDYYTYRALSCTCGLASNHCPHQSMNYWKEYLLLEAQRSVRSYAHSAARDPLSASGEWRLIRPRSQNLIDFQRSVMVYAGNLLPQPTNPQMRSYNSLQLRQSSTWWLCVSNPPAK